MDADPHAEERSAPISDLEAGKLQTKLDGSSSQAVPRSPLYEKRQKKSVRALLTNMHVSKCELIDSNMGSYRDAYGPAAKHGPAIPAHAGDRSLINPPVVCEATSLRKASWPILGYLLSFHPRSCSWGTP